MGRRIWAWIAIAALTTGCGGGRHGHGGDTAASVDDGPIVSMGPLRLGASMDDVRATLGPEARSVDRAEEASAYEDSGYKTEGDPVFDTGFDTILVFEPHKHGKKAPVAAWKMFFRSDRLVAMKLSGYVYEGAVAERTGFAPACYLLAPESGVREALGDDAEKLPERDSSGEPMMQYVYRDRGVRVLVQKGTIRVIDVFKVERGHRRSDE
jgi:hypothetical protein